MELELVAHIARQVDSGHVVVVELVLTPVLRAQLVPDEGRHDREHESDACLGNLGPTL